LDNYVLGSLGNSPVGVCAGPGLANTDFSIYKNFKVTERIGLQFRIEFFNLFNRVQFRADQLNTTLATDGYACTINNVGDANFGTRCPNGVTNIVSWDRATEGDPNFGSLDSPDRGPREIQYALKITF
jgi:hypothetical protein